MHALLAGFLLILAFPPQDDADKQAAELLQKIEDKVMKAKTVRIEFEAKVEGRGPGREDMMNGTIKLGGKGGFIFKASEPNDKQMFFLRSDGREIVTDFPGGDSTGQLGKALPADIEKCLRMTASHANLLGVVLQMTPKGDLGKLLTQLKPKEAKIEGKEKIGSVEASIVTYSVEGDFPQAMKFSVRSWIDTEKLVVLKRQISMGPGFFTETVTRFALDEPLPEDEFEFQSASLLKAGLTIQLVKAIELHARFTGGLPKSLEALAKRPADLPADVFWPEGGFWIGGAIPNDVVYAAGEGFFTLNGVKHEIGASAPVAASSDRLNKFYTARVQLQLLRGAIEGYWKSMSSPPKSSEDLVRKPESARFWPEGGWIAGGRLPPDPWGEPYVIRFSPRSALVSATRYRKRTLKLADVTVDERNALDLAAYPAAGEKDRQEIEELIRQLGSESIEERESATKAILAKGPVVFGVVVKQLAVEKDPETANRLKGIRDRLKTTKPAWEAELRPLVTQLSIGGGGAAMMSSNERNASATLKTITTAQADFRANDRDGNRRNDFWVRDVAGLYGLEPATGAAPGEGAPGKDATNIIKLIEPSAAMADATEGRWIYPALEFPETMPKAGYYFAALTYYQSAGKSQRYHEGNGLHVDQFGFVAYPAEYGVNGRRTYIVSEDNTIWTKDLEGEEIDTWPADPSAEGWKKLD